jgi:hypothetical protein
MFHVAVKYGVLFKRHSMKAMLLETRYPEIQIQEI